MNPTSVRGTGCVGARQLDRDVILPNAELGGSVQLWEWIGAEPATTFSY